MENYILRIYRRGEKDRKELVGTVEEVGATDVQGFQSADELWGFLCARRKRVPRRRGHRSPPIGGGNETD